MVTPMGHSSPQMDAKRAALIALMDRSCEEIRALELPAQLSVDDRDLRPRIEYFHDAVRTMTDHPEAMYQLRTRLSVEWLAFDLSMLRAIQDKPLTRLNRGQVMGQSQSRALRIPPESVPPAIRAKLSEHYRSYTVFFAALFAEAADRNFHSRVDQMNQEVEETAQVEQALKLLEQGKGGVTEAQVEEMILHLSNEEIRNRLMVLLHQQAMKKRERFSAAAAYAKASMANIDKAIASLDKQHMHFLSGQMMVMQESKDLVKKLSGQGLNLAGKFLEAVAQAMGIGRGR